MMENKFPIYQRDFKVEEVSLVFDYRVTAQCRIGCTRYNNKPTCPPKIPGMEFYQKALLEYKHLSVIARQYPYADGNFSKHWRNHSTNEIHKLTLKREIMLFQQGFSYAKAFIGGCCKLCLTCNPQRCNIPSRGRTPLEATGLNVFLLMNSIGLTYQEPPQDFFWRLGVVFY